MKFKLSSILLTLTAFLLISTRTLAASKSNCLDYYHDQSLIGQFWSPISKTQKTVYLIHATDFPPVDGVLKAGAILPASFSNKNARPLTEVFRTTVHFSLGGLVKSHDEGNWDYAEYVVMIPYESVSHRIVNLSVQDTYVVGDLQLPPGSIVLSKSRSTINRNFGPGVTVIDISKGKKPLSEKVKDVLKNINGVVIETSSEAKQHSGNVIIEGQTYTERKIFELSHLTRSNLSFGNAAFGYKGKAPILIALENISLGLVDAEMGTPLDRTEMAIKYAAAKILVPQAKKWLVDNGWYSESVNKHFLVLHQRLEKWAQENNWRPSEALDLKKSDTFQLALVLKELNSRQIETIFASYALQNNHYLRSLKIRLSATKLYNPSSTERPFFLKWLNDSLSEYDKYDRVDIIDFITRQFGHGFHNNSDYLKGLLEMLYLKPVFEIYSDNPLPKNPFRTIDDFLNAILVTHPDSLPNDAATASAIAVLNLIFKNDPSTINTSDINNWISIKYLLFRNLQAKDIYRGSLKIVFAPLNTVDTSPFNDHYTEHSVYRDLYLLKHGSIESVSQKLDLNPQFLHDFPTYKDLFQSSMSLMQIIEKYRL